MNAISRFQQSHRCVLVVAVLLTIGGCVEPPRPGLQLTVDDSSVEGTFVRDGVVVRFRSTSENDARATVALDVDGNALEVTLDLTNKTLIEDAHDSTFDFKHRAILLALRDAVEQARPDLRDSLHGTLLVRVADRYAEVPIGRAMPRHAVDLAVAHPTDSKSDEVQSGCGDDGVSCLPGTSGNSWAVFSASGVCRAEQTAYGDNICRGRCGVGCNPLDNDYTYDCLDHDVCLDHSSDCNDEFNDAADDFVATIAPLCFGGTSRPKPPGIPSVITPHPAPPSRLGAMMTYDTARSRVVLYGGNSPGFIENTWHLVEDTWEFDGTWIERKPDYFPLARDVAAMTYDAAHNRVVMFGGAVDGGKNSGVTYAFDGTNWSRAAETGPSARQSATMSYDIARGRHVLFGGGGNGFLGDTWEFDGTTWTQLAPATSPPARYAATMAYDAARGRVVLFGGYGSSGFLADTWEFDGTTWTQRVPVTTPRARSNATMTYDAARGRVVLFGGNVPEYIGDTWEFDGTTWTQLAPATNPPARALAAMTYDAARSRVVLFGGQGWGVFALADTWEFDGATWTQR